MTAPFDTAEALRLNEARQLSLGLLLDELTRSAGVTLRSGLDAGCGFGFFSRFLSDRGLDVTAVDVRRENAQETANRNPDVRTAAMDIQDAAVLQLGRFDLVLCFGLMYHLENPLQGIRHLEALTGQVLVMESVVAPGRSTATYFFEEERLQNQAVGYVALVPSERWFIKALYTAGFGFVYRCSQLPRHRDFRSSLFRRRRRTVLVAARFQLPSASLICAREPRVNPHMWDRPWIRPLLSSAGIRRSVRSHFGRFLSL